MSSEFFWIDLLYVVLRNFVKYIKRYSAPISPDLSHFFASPNYFFKGNRDIKTIIIQNKKFALIVHFFSYRYTVENFLDKNKDTLFQDFKRLLFNSKHPMLKEQWPEGGQDITKVTKRPQTTATIFKNSMVSLVGNLMKKVLVFQFIILFLFWKLNANDEDNTLFWNIKGNLKKFFSLFTTVESP